MKQGIDRIVGGILEGLVQKAKGNLPRVFSYVTTTSLNSTSNQFNIKRAYIDEALKYNAERDPKNPNEPEMVIDEAYVGQ